MKYTEITTSLATKNLHPVYFMMGDEPYYIDKLADAFSRKILTSEEKEFNQTILYGKDIETEQVIAEAKQFPFGSDRRVVIIKEAQHLKNIEMLDSYLDNVLTSTILVICYKGKTIDKRKKFGRTLNSKAIVFTSNKLYENQIPVWINNYIKEKGFSIENSASAVLSEYIGNSLSKITNELKKLMQVVEKDKPITTKMIEYHIGISKDFNVFELQNALAERNVVKSNKIINHFSKNPKNHHIVPIISSIFSYFQKIIIYHQIDDKNSKNVASILKVNPFFISQYKRAAENYSNDQLLHIFKYLKNYDLKSKGINNKSTSSEGLLKELIFKILHC